MEIDFASFRLAELPEPKPDDSVLQLRDRFQKHNFDEQGMAPFHEAFPVLDQTLTGMFRACERNPNSTAQLIRLFILSQKVDRASIEEALGAELTARLVVWGLLVELEDKVASTVDIHPCQGVWVATDRQIGMERYMEAVYPLGGDSFALARLTPRSPFSLALDIATGSGVHAILAAAHCQSVHGVDIARRPLDFACFNGALNEVRKQLFFFEGSLFEPLPPVQYDLIVANPPWVPTPDEPVELYRSGGGDGEVLTRAVVNALDERLQTGGWLAMYVEYPKFAHQTYLQRVSEWLPEGSWGTVLLNLKHWTSEGYVMSQVASHTDQSLPDEFDRWMTSYESYGIDGMGWAMLYIKKLDEGRPGWSVERESDFPAIEQAWLADWLEGLDRAHGADPPAEWCPTFDPGAQLWHQPATGKYAVRWPEHSLQDIELEPRQGELAERLDGKLSVADLIGFEHEMRILNRLGLLQ